MRKLNPVLLVLFVLLLLLLVLAFCAPRGLAQDDPMPCYDVQINGVWWHFCGIEITNTATPPPYPTPTIEIAPTATSTPINTLHCTVATHAGLNVRSGPDVRYDVIAGPLAYGVEIVPIGGAGNWIRIANPSGWVADWLVMCE